MTPETGDTVRVYHRVSTLDGQEVESSFGCGTPLRFVIDSGRVLRGLNDLVKDLSIGERATTTVPAARAHGEHDPGKIKKVRKTTFFQGLKVGQVVTFQGDLGQPIQVRVLEEQDDVYVLDMNHLLAGKDLTVEVELLEILEDPQTRPFV